MAQNESFGEYDIQAGFIFKFISFVEWPQKKAEGDTITIGILGESPFGDAFKDLEGQPVEKCTVEVKYFDSAVDYNTLKQCQLLYISKSESKKLDSILKAIENHPILTISACKNFAEEGGVIGFVKKKSRIAFEINNTSAKRAHLDIRSMLKRIAVRLIDQKTKTRGGRDA